MTWRFERFFCVFIYFLFLVEMSFEINFEPYPIFRAEIFVCIRRVTAISKWKPRDEKGREETVYTMIKL